MRLWEYLKEKMRPYAERVAFAGTGTTYRELLNMEYEAGDRGGLKLCTGNTREEQALNIIRCIAEGNAAVPVSREYGDKRYEEIRKAVGEGEGEKWGDLAFMLFTSGTTGTPKGVMLTHENVVANLEYISGYFRLEGRKRLGIMRPLVHVSALVGELLYGLICGMEIYFYEEAFLPQRLTKFLREGEIEVFCTTPTVYLTLSKYGRTAGFPVKVSAISGERLTESAARKISETFPQTEFYNVYGLTEHSPRVCALTPNDFLRKAGSVGKTIGQVCAEIRDGELLIKSPCVMKGYFKDAARTEEKLERGWLHTGDMARRDEEGYYYIDGRKDDMIIRAGMNIFPEEIEEEAKKCPGVEDCAAYGRTGEDGITELCLKYTGECAPSALRTRLAESLDAHFMPNRIERAERLERTASGKKVRR